MAADTWADLRCAQPAVPADGDAAVNRRLHATKRRALPFLDVRVLVAASKEDRVRSVDEGCQHTFGSDACSFSVLGQQRGDRVGATHGADPRIVRIRERRANDQKGSQRSSYKRKLGNKVRAATHQVFTAQGIYQYVRAIVTRYS